MAAKKATRKAAVKKKATKKVARKKTASRKKAAKKKTAKKKRSVKRSAVDLVGSEFEPFRGEHQPHLLGARGKAEVIEREHADDSFPFDFGSNP